jgi:hypothetical protein
MRPRPGELDDLVFTDPVAARFNHIALGAGRFNPFALIGRE